MDEDFKAVIREAFSRWVESLSFNEIKTNEPLVRTIESFERHLFSSME